MTFDLRALVFVVASVAVAAPAHAQQMTVSVGNWGSPQPPPQVGVPSVQSNGWPSGPGTQLPQQAGVPQVVAAAQGLPGNGNGVGLYASAITLSSLAAYGRYMQYLTFLNYQMSHNGEVPTPDAKEYFTNGAAATDVPTTGPGSGYFTNGSEALSVPTTSLPPTPSPSPPPPPPAQQPPRPPPWVVVYENPSTPPAPPPAPPATTTPPPEAPETRAPAAAMSFQDWLQSMGLDNSDTSVESPESNTPHTTSGEVETASIAEPAALAYDVRERVAYALPEKTRAHTVARGGGLGPLVGISGAFATGLILGGLAMLRLRDRTRKNPTP